MRPHNGENRGVPGGSKGYPNFPVEKSYFGFFLEIITGEIPEKGPILPDLDLSEPDLDPFYPDLDLFWT